MSEESIRTTAELIRHADAVLVGAGSGLSSAAGYNHYHRNAVFEANFHDLRKPMGFKVFFMGSITFTQNRNSSGDFIHAI